MPESRAELALDIMIEGVSPYIFETARNILEAGFKDTTSVFSVAKKIVGYNFMSVGSADKVIKIAAAFNGGNVDTIGKTLFGTACGFLAAPIGTFTGRIFASFMPKYIFPQYWIPAVGTVAFDVLATKRGEELWEQFDKDVRIGITKGTLNIFGATIRVGIKVLNEGPGLSREIVNTPKSFEAAFYAGVNYNNLPAFSRYQHDAMGYVLTQIGKIARKTQSALNCIRLPSQSVVIANIDPNSRPAMTQWLDDKVMGSIVQWISDGYTGARNLLDRLERAYPAQPELWMQVRSDLIYWQNFHKKEMYIKQATSGKSKAKRARKKQLAGGTL